MKKRMAHPSRFFAISVHPMAFFGFFCQLFFLPPSSWIALFIGVGVHEAGHLIAAGMTGMRPSGIAVLPVGFTLHYPNAPGYRQEIFVALAGPFCNLLSIAFSPLFPSFSPAVVPVSAALAFVNLLPISLFDGGCALKALLTCIFGLSAADKILGLTDIIFFSFLWLCGIFVLFYSEINPSWMIFCVYLFAALFLKKAGK